MIGQTYGNPEILHGKFLMEDNEVRLSLTQTSPGYLVVPSGSPLSVRPQRRQHQI